MSEFILILDNIFAEKKNIAQKNCLDLLQQKRLNSTMESKQRQKQLRYAEKLKKQGRRVYSARIKCETADAFVSIAKTQGKTAAALTEEVLSEFVRNNLHTTTKGD